MEWKEPCPRSTESWVQVAALSVLKWRNLGSSPTCLEIQASEKVGGEDRGSPKRSQVCGKDCLEASFQLLPSLMEPCYSSSVVLIVVDLFLFSFGVCEVAHCCVLEPDSHSLLQPNLWLGVWWTPPAVLGSWLKALDLLSAPFCLVLQKHIPAQAFHELLQIICFTAWFPREFLFSSIPGSAPGNTGKILLPQTYLMIFN